jgi:hypothetical protein
MLVLRVTVNAVTGEVTEEWIDDPNVIDPVDGAIADAAAAAAQAVLDGNESTIKDEVRNAYINLRAYRDAASPSQAQTVAVVKLLCSCVIKLGRLELRELDGTD